MDEHDAIWAETTDGGLLRQLFGYYPTMHDAIVRELRFDARRNVTMILDYQDSPEGGGEELAVRVELRWAGVRSVDFDVRENFLMGLECSRDGDDLRTTFREGFGIAGTLVSERFEAILSLLDPIVEPAESLRLVCEWDDPEL